MSLQFALDPRLEADTHLIGELPLSRLLLMDDARFPWMILVPRIAGARELIDLDAADRAALTSEITILGRIVEAQLRPDKLNIAALGNVVAQLHIHMIARFQSDAVWPLPVWGHGERVRYAADALAARIDQLRAALPTVAA